MSTTTEGPAGTAPAPRVTVITVTYNAGVLLEQTMSAVLALRYPAIEYIVIDGGSTDGTLALLDRHRRSISHVVSEPDNGIYDAMNKGLRLASGDFIWFLNAGDTPCHPDVLAPLLRADPLPDYVFSDTRLVHADGKLANIARAPDQIDWRVMSRGMLVSHQSFLPRRSLAPLYDLRYRYIADQKWVVDILRHCRAGLRLDAPLSNYLLGGLSHRRFSRFVAEKIRYSFTDLTWAQAVPITLRDLLNAARFYLVQVFRSVARRV